MTTLIFLVSLVLVNKCKAIISPGQYFFNVEEHSEAPEQDNRTVKDFIDFGTEINYHPINRFARSRLIGKEIGFYPLKDKCSAGTTERFYPGESVSLMTIITYGNRPMDKDCKKINSSVSTGEAPYGSYRSLNEVGVLSRGDLNHVIDYSICSVNNVVISHCREKEQPTVESLSWIFTGKKWFIVKTLNIINHFQGKDILAYACYMSDSNKLMDISNPTLKASMIGGFCDGDETYAENFDAKGTQDCYCKKPNVENWRIVDKNGKEMPIALAGYDTFKVVRRKKKRDSHKKDKAINCPHCDFKCVKKGVTLNSESAVRMYKVCHLDHCITGNFTQDLMVVPKSFLVSNDKMIITVWFNDNTYNTTEQACSELNVCNIIDCYFCKDMFLNHQCMPWWEYIVLILACNILFFNLAILFVAIRWLHYGASFLMKPACCTIRFCGRFCKKSAVITSGVAIKGYKRVMNDDEEQGISVKTPPPVVAHSVNRKQQRRIRLSPIIVLVFFVSLVSTCSDTGSMTITQKQCQFGEDGLKTCFVRGEANLGVAPVGQESCYMLYSEDKKLLGTLIVKTKDIRVVCNKNSLYFVGHPEGRCEFNNHCFSVGFCNGGSPCNIGVNGDIPGKPTANKHVGETRCCRSAGCAGNGCGLCSDQCTMWRGYYLGDGDFWEIYDCPSWSYTIDIEVTLVQPGGSKTESLKIEPGISHTSFKTTFSLKSISVPPTPKLSTCFATHGVENGMTSMVPCNQRNEIVAGKIGEIQCPTSTDAKTLTKNCFMAQGLIKGSCSRKVSCQFKTVDIKKVAAANSLPRDIGNARIMEEDNQVVAEYEGAAVFQIQMDMDDVTLVSKSDLNYCYATQINMTGCYSCLTGASLFLKVHTNMGEAVGVVKCPDSLIEFPVSANSEEKIIRKVLSLNRGSINEDCYISCPAGSKKFRIEGELSYVKDRDNGNSTHNNGVVIHDDTGFQWPWNFKNLWSFGLFRFMTIIAIFALILIFIPTLVICCKRKRKIR